MQQKADVVARPRISRLSLTGLVWALLALLLVLPQLRGEPISFVGDDVMRLVNVHDLLNGQNWFDNFQHRTNTPWGAPMHWSRLIDGPMALILAGLRLFLDPTAADTALQLIWPLLVLLGLAGTLVILADWLAGRSAAVAVVLLAPLAVSIYADFHPGDLDHHNVVQVLCLVAILATLRARQSVGWAVAAGLAAATVLAIASEGLAVVAPQLLLIPLFWVIDPARSARPMLAFGASFALGELAHLMLVTPPADYLTTQCDALSFTYVSMAWLYGLAIACAWLVTGRRAAPAWQRLGVLAVAGLVAMAAALAISPACLHGPYGNLEPWLVDMLLAPIGEAQPLMTWMIPLRPVLAALILPVTGLGACIAAVLMHRGERRIDWLAMLAFLAFSMIVTFAQVRGLRLATIIALLPAAWALATAWRAFKPNQTLWTTLRLVGLAFAFMGLLHLVVAKMVYEALTPPSYEVEDVVFADDLKACVMPEAYARLQQLPTGRVMSSLLIGRQILYETDHSIVSSAYHRNVAGLKDAVRFFGGGEAEARAVVDERALDYLVLCRGVQPGDALEGMPDFDASGFDWLTPISAPDEPLQIYRIMR
ncbi:hypothetical protein [Devosia sp.]|uniref:hypothetical protein n=1 Tax=Devosia sp. TaxID=1871048 RepID=UPI003A8DD97C